MQIETVEQYRELNRRGQALKTVAKQPIEASENIGPGSETQPELMQLCGRVAEELVVMLEWFRQFDDMTEILQFGEALAAEFRKAASDQQLAEDGQMVTTPYHLWRDLVLTITETELAVTRRFLGITL